MYRFISFNHQILSPEEAFLSAVSSAALYGRGIFTTIAIHNSIPFLWEKHWRRLSDNAHKIGISLDEFSERTIEKSLLETIEKNNVRSGRARLTFYDAAPSSIWQANSVRKINLLIQTSDFRAVPESFRLTVSPYRINSASPLVGVKSCNYLENILAHEDAKVQGFDEAVRLNEKGEIVSTCLANIFWKKNSAIYTPSLETGCLRGTTREFILESFIVKEQKANLAELIEADEIFLSSAGIGIVKVAEFIAPQTIETQHRKATQ